MARRRWSSVISKPRQTKVCHYIKYDSGIIITVIAVIAFKGIWTKHLKAKTELHQTVIDRCLKSLLQKQLVKVVKSVKVGPFQF